MFGEIVRSRERTRIETHSSSQQVALAGIVRSRERTRIETANWRISTGIGKKSSARESGRGLKLRRFRQFNITDDRPLARADAD